MHVFRVVTLIACLTLSSAVHAGSYMLTRAEQLGKLGKEFAALGSEFQKLLKLEQDPEQRLILIVAGGKVQMLAMIFILEADLAGSTVMMEYASDKKRFYLHRAAAMTEEIHVVDTEVRGVLPDIRKQLQNERSRELVTKTIDKGYDGLEVLHSVQRMVHSYGS